jgi:dienelactone hydrolase
MNRIRFAAVAMLLLTGCSGQSSPSQARSANPPAPGGTRLTEARKGFKTETIPQGTEKEPVAAPPAKLFGIVRYESPVGKLPAYLTPDPMDGKKHPAIIWITGGDCNSIGEVWKDAPSSNDQTASAFRKAGLVMMFPSLRGGNDNPGVKEGFYGEVDDLLAAADFLAQQTYVDSTRIYLGGHSTGGTMAMLAAECSDRFRAVFSFGPVETVASYGPEYMPFNWHDRRELELRAPLLWLDTIKSPVYVIEGDQGNIESLQAMAGVSKNPLVHFLAVKGVDHFGTLAPITKRIAKKLLADDGPTTNLVITEAEVNKPFGH